MDFSYLSDNIINNREFLFNNKQLNKYLLKYIDSNLLQKNIICNNFNTNFIIQQIIQKYNILQNQFINHYKINRTLKKNRKTLWSIYKLNKHLYNTKISNATKFIKYSKHEILLIFLEEWFLSYYIKLAFPKYSINPKLFSLINSQCNDFYASSTDDIILYNNNLSYFIPYIRNASDLINDKILYNLYHSSIINQFNNNLFIVLLRIDNNFENKQYYQLYCGFNLYKYIKNISSDNNIIILTYSIIYNQKNGLSFNNIFKSLNIYYSIKWDIFIKQGYFTLDLDINYNNYIKNKHFIYHEIYWENKTIINYYDIYHYIYNYLDSSNNPILIKTNYYDSNNLYFNALINKTINTHPIFYSQETHCYYISNKNIEYFKPFD